MCTTRSDWNHNEVLPNPGILKFFFCFLFKFVEKYLYWLNYLSILAFKLIYSKNGLEISKINQLLYTSPRWTYTIWFFYHFVYGVMGVDIYEVWF